MSNLQFTMGNLQLVISNPTCHCGQFHRFSYPGNLEMNNQLTDLGLKAENNFYKSAE